MKLYAKKKAISGRTKLRECSIFPPPSSTINSLKRGEHIPIKMQAIVASISLKIYRKKPIITTERAIIKPSTNMFIYICEAIEVITTIRIR